MHQSDEGLTKYFLEQLMDPEVSTLSLSNQQRQQLDQRWLQIIVPGQNDRQPRSLFELKRYKAHELRFLLHFGLPYIAQGIAPKNVRRKETYH